MYPKRFAESLCLKCHHDVVELEPSEQFPDPPAPKLVEGFHLDRAIRLLRLPRDQRLRRAERAASVPICAPSRTMRPRRRPCWPAAGWSKQQSAWAGELVDHPTRRRRAARAARIAERRRAGQDAENARPGRITKRLLAVAGRRRDAGPAAQSRAQPAARGQQDRLRRSCIRGSASPAISGPHQDAAVLRARRAPGRQGPGAVGAVRADRDSRRRRVSAGQEPAVRVHAAAEGGHSQGVGRARQANCSRRAAAWPATARRFPRPAR